MKLRVMLMAAMVILASCSTAGTTTPTVGEASVISTTTSPAPQAAAESTTTVAAKTAFEVALDETTTAGSYEFGGQLIAYVGSSTATTGLHGWVDGTNQLIVTQSANGVVETAVKEGIATVTKDGVASTVDLGAVEAAPSFELLRAIEVQEDTAGMIKGVVPAALISGSAASGFLDVTVWYSDVISAYEIADPNGAWELSMTFSNVGTFDSSATP